MFFPDQMHWVLLENLECMLSEKGSLVQKCRTELAPWDNTCTRLVAGTEETLIRAFPNSSSLPSPKGVHNF